MNDSQPTLDGMDPPRPDATPMEKVARAQIARLRDEGRLTDEHELPAQAIIDLSRAVGMSAQSGKAAGMAMAARELREFIALLPKTLNDEFGALQQQLDQANAEANAKAAGK